MRALAACLLLASLGTAQAQSAFDGTWDVSVACPEARGARGYTLQFPATVQQGTLTGAFQRGNNNNGTLHISGPIQADGSAQFEATGVVGDPQNAARGSGRGTPFRYAVAARFAGNRGTGQRVQTRACDFTFVKR